MSHATKEVNHSQPRTKQSVSRQLDISAFSSNDFSITYTGDAFPAVAMAQDDILHIRFILDDRYDFVVSVHGEAVSPKQKIYHVAITPGQNHEQEIIRLKSLEECIHTHPNRRKC